MRNFVRYPNSDVIMSQRTQQDYGMRDDDGDDDGFYLA